jgi:hypothetical protein
MHRDADFPFVLCLYKLTNVEHLGHFTVRGTEESSLPRVPQPRLDLNTENGTIHGSIIAVFCFRICLLYIFVNCQMALLQQYNA